VKYVVPAREVGDSLFINSDSPSCAIARFARSILNTVGNLGFRSAPPQALCYRRAPRATAIDEQLVQSFLKHVEHSQTLLKLTVYVSCRDDRVRKVRRHR